MIYPDRPNFSRFDREEGFRDEFQYMRPVEIKQCSDELFNCFATGGYPYRRSFIREEGNTRPRQAYVDVLLDLMEKMFFNLYKTKSYADTTTLNQDKNFLK